MSSPNQDIEHGRQTSQDSIQRESIPQKRTSWLAPILFFVNTVLIIVYGCVENTEVLINIGFSLLGVVLGPIFRCLCIFVEELFQFRSRYRRNILNLFKRCFNGISWKPVIAFVLIDVIPCVLVKKSSFDLEDVISILSGVSVGPLIVYLLKLNAQSDVDLSRLLEGKGLHPAYVLAWNYYINYLEKALPVFNRHFFSRSSPIQAQASNECSDRNTKFISSKRLILLFSDNYKKEVDLVDLDNHISKITDICEAGYKFPVYGLKYNGNEYKYVIRYVDEPLESIKRIRDFDRIKLVYSDPVKDQVMLLYRTLVNDILTKDDYCRNKCLPILITETRSLENGGLVKLIMSYVKMEECISNANDHTKSHDPPVITEQPQAEGTSSSEHLVDIGNPYQSSNDIAARLHLRKRPKIDGVPHNLKTSSSILKGEIAFMKQLQQWLGEKCKWNLCYRASRDGWSAQDFHRHCDNKGPTVVLVKAHDSIFGGYTDQHWNSSIGCGTYKCSNSSFLFSLRNNDNLAPFIANIKQGQEQNAVCCHTNYGPIFGGGNDLCIFNNPHVNQSYSNFGYTYQLPLGYVYGSEQAKNLLAGQFRLITTEIEIFN